MECFGKIFVALAPLFVFIASSISVILKKDLPYYEDLVCERAGEANVEEAKRLKNRYTLIKHILLNAPALAIWIIGLIFVSV